MEIEHLRVACELMKRIEKRDPEEILPISAFAEPLRFQPNKAYVRSILASQINLTSKDSDFVPVATLPQDDRYYAYQRRVNGDFSPTEEVIRANREKNGRDYRLETEGWIESEWGVSENKRRAKFYALTPLGRKMLRAEEGRWTRFVATMGRVLAATPRTVAGQVR